MQPSPLAAGLSQESACAERRSRERHRLILRVGIVDDGTCASICLVKNISSRGVQLRIYRQTPAGRPVTLRVGDEDPIPGKLVWSNDSAAGIQFDKELHPDALMRVQQKAGSARRRAAPRLSLEGAAVLRAQGNTYSANLCDISTSGAKIRTGRPVAHTGTAILEMRGMPPLKAFIRWIDNDEVGLSFATPLPIEVISLWLGTNSPATPR